MAMKTIIKRLIKYLPISIETQSAIANDETVRKDITEPAFIVEADPIETITVISGTGEIIENERK
jgi:recombination protein RecT